MANEYNARLYARSQPVRDRLACKQEETACSDCGALRCLCRPRFFAGQLLSEQDLNRLDEYIREKNRLHTLHLHGWGVVNGLEVSCDPCGKGVVVGCGYAISPCGDDIVVCDRVSVDVCKLIDRCCHQERACQPYRGGSEPGDCGESVEDWVLAIRYTEHGSRGISALRSPACSCGERSGNCGCAKPSGGCSCGKSGAGCSCGKASGGCSCGTRGMFPGVCRCQDTTVSRGRATPAECEPTQICESYSFDVFRAPKRTGDGSNTAISGPIAERMRCCIQALQNLVRPTPTVPYSANPAAWSDWCCDTKAAIAEYVETMPTRNCDLIARVRATPCPDPTLPPAQFEAAMNAALALFYELLIDVMFACLCAALMPPCPEPAEDDRVPLAVVSVRRKGCQVISVCNWTPLRKIALTIPTLQYWLSLFPIFSAPINALHTICCGRIFRGGDSTLLSQTPLDNTVLANNAAFNGMMVNAMARRTPLDARTLTEGVFGVGRAPENDKMSAVEANNLPQFLMLNQMLAPVLAGLSPATADTDGLRARIDKLETELASLKNR